MLGYGDICMIVKMLLYALLITHNPFSHTKNKYKNYEKWTIKENMNIPEDDIKCEIGCTWCYTTEISSTLEAKAGGSQVYDQPKKLIKMCLKIKF